MPQKFLQSVKTRIFYVFLKIVKSALFQNTTEQQNRLKSLGIARFVLFTTGIYINSKFVLNFIYRSLIKFRKKTSSVY